MTLAICALQACSNEIIDDNGLPVVVQLAYYKSGTDLLNPATSNGYSFGEINLFNLVNDKPELLYNSNLQAPRYCALIDSANQYRLVVYPQNDLTVLQLNQTTFDTLSYLITGSKVQIWYNSKLMIESGPLFTLKSLKILK